MKASPGRDKREELAEPLPSRLRRATFPKGTAFRGGDKLSGSALRRPLEERRPPLRGKMSPQVTKGGIWQSRQALTERAHAVSPVAKASDAMRNLPATAEAFTHRGKVARSAG